MISEFGQQELGNTAWAFAELRVTDIPLLSAISAAAIATIHEIGCDAEEVSRGAYALAWAQGRLSLGDQARALVAGHAAQGRCNRLSLGLIIVDEEWSRVAPPGGAITALEALTGQSMSPQQAVEASDFMD